MREIFAHLDRLADALDFDGIERAALDALEGAAGADAHELWSWVAWARFEEARYRASLEAAEAAGDLLQEGKARFHLWDLEGAHRALDGYDPGGDPEKEAEALWYRGVLAEFALREAEAEELFARAEALVPDVFARPVRLADEEVDAICRDALVDLPQKLEAVVRETTIEVHPLPKPHPDVDPLTMGVYMGVSRLERSVEQSLTMPPRIELYQKNIERSAADRDEAVEELRITLLHEVGHQFGHDEERLRRMGLE